MTGGLSIRSLTVTIDGATILAGVDVDVGAGDWLAVGIDDHAGDGRGQGKCHEKRDCRKMSCAHACSWGICARYESGLLSLN